MVLDLCNISSSIHLNYIGMLFYFAIFFAKGAKKDLYDLEVEVFRLSLKTFNENSAPLPFADPVVLLVELPRI